jgi:hypothetical protein
LGGSFQTDTLSLNPPNSGESAMNTKKPLWMNEPDADQTSIRFHARIVIRGYADRNLRNTYRSSIS